MAQPYQNFTVNKTKIAGQGQDPPGSFFSGRPAPLPCSGGQPVHNGKTAGYRLQPCMTSTQTDLADKCGPWRTGGRRPRHQVPGPIEKGPCTAVRGGPGRLMAKLEKRHENTYNTSDLRTGRGQRAPWRPAAECGDTLRENQHPASPAVRMTGILGRTFIIPPAIHRTFKERSYGHGHAVQGSHGT